MYFMHYPYVLPTQRIYVRETRRPLNPGYNERQQTTAPLHYTDCNKQVRFLNSPLCFGTIRFIAFKMAWLENDSAQVSMFNSLKVRPEHAVRTLECPPAFSD